MHTTDSYSVNDYETAASNIINSTDCKDVDVILAKIPRTSQYFSNTPYYRLKAMFTSKGFASQMITDATFNNLNWSYLNLGIALFSKAGGTPWVLASEMKKVDMVLGISVSNVITYKNRAGGYPRYVGCSNVFDSYGKWMFFDGTAEPFEEDKRTRNKQLKQLVNQAIAKFNALKNKPPKNIVIHYFKRFGQREIQSIKDALHESIGDDFNLACISINSTHPYRMYDKSTKDGSFPRGSYVYLNDKECLLSTTGETPIAGRRLGTPKLLQIRMDENTNSFMNMDEIVYQIFALTKLNWATSMSMNREPVTLAFSNAIAYLTAAMSESEWKGVTSVCPTLNGRPWFL
jgi:argonaute-like protein implicated in RNA metabolism and viral defense